MPLPAATSTTATVRSAPVSASRRIYPSEWLVLLLGLVVSAAVFQALRQREEQRAVEEFERRALTQHLTISQSMEKFAHLLASVQRLHDPNLAAMTNEVDTAAELLRSQGLPILSLQRVFEKA